MSGATAILERYWRAWAARDCATSFALYAPDILYALHVPQEVLPFGGEVVGKPAVCDRMRMILDIFDTLQYEGRVMHNVEDQVSGRVTYRFRHKICREVIDGSLRVEAQFRDGLIAQWTEYTDVEKVRAFMRLVAWQAHDG